LRHHLRDACAHGAGTQHADLFCLVAHGRLNASVSGS
jgi:hypothetical protein